MAPIICVHQGMEMYGSDKSFVAAVAALGREPGLDPQVIVPQRGPIFRLFEQAGLRAVQTRHLWVLRKADFLRGLTLGLPANLQALARAVRILRRGDAVYVNTAVILDFLLASILTRRPIIVHVREIPGGAAMAVIRRLLIASHARVIFNSAATRDAFALHAGNPQTVVYNGFPLPAPTPKARYDGSGKLRLLCIGRLNAWKGQEVLVRALALLSAQDRARVSLRIVGGVYKDQTHFRDRIIAEIAAAGLGTVVEMVDFIEDPAQEYHDADVVVVPSTQPEPFGRVAIEGMAHGCAIIASDHGGLTEIVRAGETGQRVAPGDAAALAQAIRACLDTPALVARQGEAARADFAARFTQEASDAALIAAIRPHLRR